jgi:methylated-DNA-[protein]-cysteine S-methyltransferase
MDAARTFVLDRLPSPLGTLLLVSDGEARLRALDFASHEARMRRLLERHYGAGGYALVAGPAPAAITGALAAFFDGALAAIDAIPVRTAGTAFQERVWAALRRIPAGATTSYGRLAAALGAPSASRAVGLANGANPVVIVVPCHRVIGAAGALTGYGGGIERKRWLLDHERHAGAPPAHAQGELL